jgi:hypothetical protein
LISVSRSVLTVNAFLYVAHKQHTQNQYEGHVTASEKGNQSPAEAAKVAAREKMSETLWNKCATGLLVTQKELTRLIKAGADIE